MFIEDKVSETRDRSLDIFYVNTMAALDAYCGFLKNLAVQVSNTPRINLHCSKLYSSDVH